MIELRICWSFVSNCYGILWTKHRQVSPTQVWHTETSLSVSGALLWPKHTSTNGSGHRMHTHTHTHARTHARTHAHTQHACTHTHMHAHTHARTRARSGQLWSRKFALLPFLIFDLLWVNCSSQFIKMRDAGSCWPIDSDAAFWVPFTKISFLDWFEVWKFECVPARLQASYI